MRGEGGRLRSGRQAFLLNYGSGVNVSTFLEVERAWNIYFTQREANENEQMSLTLHPVFGRESTTESDRIAIPPSGFTGQFRLLERLLGRQ